MPKGFKMSMLSLRIRIFLSMIVLILIASLLMASISIIQFKNEAKEYHQERLERKETAIKEHINYVLSTTTYPLTSNNLPFIFNQFLFSNSFSIWYQDVSKRYYIFKFQITFCVIAFNIPKIKI